MLCRSKIGLFLCCTLQVLLGLGARDAAAFPLVVQPGDTLAGIAQRIYGRVENERVLAAANGHLQRWPFRVPPFVNDELTMAGQHLDRSLGDRMVVIGSTFGGGTMWLHRPIPGAPLGHTEIFTEDVGPFDEPGNLDTLLAGSGVPLGLLDLRKTEREQFAEITSIMTGPHPQPVNPLAAFDAVVYIDSVTPWHTFINA